VKKQVTVKARDLKVAKVKELSDKIGKAKTLVFANYHGLTVNQISSLRQKVKEAGGELIVAKNTLLSRALVDSSLATHDSSLLNGPTATLFAYEDEIAPIKVVADIAKTLGFPKFKFGFFNRDFLDQQAVEELSRIPTKQTLQAKLVGSLSSPIYGIVSVLQANIRNLVSVLDQATKQGSSKIESSV